MKEYLSKIKQAVYEKIGLTCEWRDYCTEYNYKKCKSGHPNCPE